MDKFSITPTGVRTKITSETAAEHNQYVTKCRRTHGYDVLELANGLSLSQMIFLSFKGELPCLDTLRLMDFLLVSLSNPGPRHGAVRAAMTAAISKSAPEHLLPIGLHVLGGERHGFAEVVASASWLKNNFGKLTTEPVDVPGFGLVYGEKDPLVEEFLIRSPRIRDENSFSHFAYNIHKMQHAGGVLDTGYCAALCLDLGFQPRECGAIFQLACSVGILAHAMEQTHAPISASTLLDDEHYDYQQR